MDSRVGDPADGLRGVKRNVAVAMENWLASLDEPPAEAVAVLRQALEDAEPLVREHTVWALEQADMRCESLRA